ncbi:MAG TPA: NADH-quinone oxidoreductase subunit J [Acidobacteria bacterium]|nr:NADH-quinone oxidoreductase subunit J [Acidobacteriota bacterium]
MIALGVMATMGAVQLTVFALLALLALGSALVVVLHRNPVVEGLFLVLHLLSIAGFYALLEAYFFAVVQVLIYAGAIMVLIIFVIMLLNLQPEAKGGPGLVPVFFAFVLGLALVLLLTRAGISFAPEPAMGAVASDFGTAAGMGREIFGTYFYPFELVSLALLSAMAGAILLAKRHLED